MNKSIVMKQKLKNIIAKDKFEFESNLLDNLRLNIINLLNGYFYVNEKDCIFKFQLINKGCLKFNFSCVVKDF